jgi:conjugal transfer pilus assembly protein TraW
VQPLRQAASTDLPARAIRSLLVVAATILGTGAHAADLGTIGPTYGIAEPHLLEFIEQRLRDKEHTGELQRLIDEARNRGVAAVRQPTPVEGVRSTEAARSWTIDPSFTLDRNIVDAQGRLLFPAGTRKNPLEVVSLSKRLLFFDARDARQVVRARELIARYEGKVKPILTGGSYLDLMKAWRVPVYYDQQGTLTRRFGIRQVPALVSQEGLRLRVDEVLLQ